MFVAKLVGMEIVHDSDCNKVCPSAMEMEDICDPDKTSSSVTLWYVAKGTEE